MSEDAKPEPDYAEMAKAQDEETRRFAIKGIEDRIKRLTAGHRYPWESEAYVAFSLKSDRACLAMLKQETTR